MLGSFGARDIQPDDVLCNDERYRGRGILSLTDAFHRRNILLGFSKPYSLLSHGTHEHELSRSKKKNPKNFEEKEDYFLFSERHKPTCLLRCASSGFFWFKNWINATVWSAIIACPFKAPQPIGLGWQHMQCKREV
jgi:hypothetical protein